MPHAPKGRFQGTTEKRFSKAEKLPEPEEKSWVGLTQTQRERIESTFSWGPEVAAKSIILQAKEYGISVQALLDTKTQDGRHRIIYDEGIRRAIQAMLGKRKP